MENPSPNIEEPQPKKKITIPKWLHNPLVWMVFGIAIMICVFIIILLVKYIFSSKPEVDKTKKKPPKPKQEQKQEPPADAVSSQPSVVEQKKEEIVSKYVATPPEVKVEASETSNDEEPKIVEEID